MMTYRTNARRLPGNGAASASPADECFKAMQRRAAAGKPIAIHPAPAEAAPSPKAAPAGDVIYGARAIAKFIFDDDSDRARRRVFNLWTYYGSREERAGFFKLKGAVCLSKSQWLSFHGLG
jgi:hypothetical protein